MAGDEARPIMHDKIGENEDRAADRQMRRRIQNIEKRGENRRAEKKDRKHVAMTLATPRRITHRRDISQRADHQSRQGDLRKSADGRDRDENGEQGRHDEMLAQRKRADRRPNQNDERHDAALRQDTIGRIAAAKKVRADQNQRQSDRRRDRNAHGQKIDVRDFGALGQSTGSQQSLCPRSSACGRGARRRQPETPSRRATAPTRKRGTGPQCRWGFSAPSACDAAHSRRRREGRR